MIEQEKGYNGWTNYETWATALWIGNEQNSYAWSRALTADAREEAGASPQVQDGIWTEEQAARFNLADALKEWIEDSMPEIEASLASDLLSSALSEVNWDEIASNYLSEE